MMTTESNSVELAAELTAPWLSNPNTRTSADDFPAFFKSMHRAVVGLDLAAGPDADEKAAQEYTPKVSPRKSLANREHIISMIDGKPYKTLRRHLTTNGLTPEEYRARYDLKPDYPMVAEAYSEARRTMAKTIGLGRKPGQRAAKAVTNKAKFNDGDAQETAAQAINTSE